MNNLIYIANLVALKKWYRQVRTLFISKDFPEALLIGLQHKVNLAIAERIERLGVVCRRNSESDIYERWPELEESFNRWQATKGDLNVMENFLKKVDQGISKSGKNYIAVIQGLKANDTQNGTRWLQGIVDSIVTEAQRIVPSLT